MPYLRMSVRHLTPDAYWNASQYDVDMTLAVQQAFADGREQAEADIRKEAEEAAEHARLMNELQERARAKAAGL